MLLLFLKAWIIGFSIAMPVGPIGMLCIKNTLTRGFKIGIAVWLGAAFADSFYWFLAGGGLVGVSSFLLDFSNVIQIIGGSFLLYLGAMEIKNMQKISSKELTIQETGICTTIWTVFLLTLANPATILSFIWIFASIWGLFLTGIDIGIMILGVFLGSLVWWLILVSIVSIIRHKLPEKFMRGIRFLSGCILMCFGLWSFINVMM